MSSIKNVIAILLCLLIISCNNKSADGKFTIIGNIKNTPNQQVYLEQLFFNEKAPEVIDTAEIKEGRFTLKGKANEEGLFRIRLEKDNQHS